MASPAQPDPQAGGTPQGAAPGGAPPSQAPAPPELMMLSKVTMLLKQLAQSRPELSAGLTKALQGINEAQSAMVTQAPAQPSTSNPQF